ncbi:choice-of-anchor Q domain-containing protein [Gemmatimonas sp.]|uniref:choice-of-anchor Q domain-containing protein n=1 Tax=Gemmatimonas sp. TaxID=1962908 RepID=UPI0039839E4E
MTSVSALIADAKLAPLAVDGLTAIHHLLSGNAAINAAPSCLVTVDQRGAPRVRGPACELGPVEEAE